VIDLSTRYLGLSLANPLVASASPLGQHLDTLCQLEDAGAAAVVLPSLFEEQITLESHQLDQHLSAGAESYAEAVSYFPELHSYRLGPDSYLEHVRRARAGSASRSSAASTACQREAGSTTRGSSRKPAPTPSS
jgi:dihydroorotate dehydrogenase (fumarate)